MGGRGGTNVSCQLKFWPFVSCQLTPSTPSVEQCHFKHFKHFNARFFVSINLFLCDSAILKNSRRDDTSLWF